MLLHWMLKDTQGPTSLKLPIQNSLDISPLPYSSKEFEKMPKATCAKCRTDMLIQLLAVHVQKCETDIWINSSDCESDQYLMSSDTEEPSILTKVANANDPKNPTITEVPPTSTKIDHFSGNLGDELDVLTTTASLSSAVMDVEVSCPVF